MSRSAKDGRHKGGHKDTQCKEIWSRRCAKVNMWSRSDKDAKRITHQHERRTAKIALRQEAP